jgi:hypothetical protein
VEKLARFHYNQVTRTEWLQNIRSPQTAKTRGIMTYFSITIRPGEAV